MSEQEKVELTHLELELARAVDHLKEFSQSHEDFAQETIDALRTVAYTVIKDLDFIQKHGIDKTDAEWEAGHGL